MAEAERRTELMKQHPDYAESVAWAKKKRQREVEALADQIVNQYSEALKRLADG